MLGRRSAEELGDHDRGKRLREVADQIDLALGRHAFEESLRERLNTWPKRLHTSRCKGLGDKTTEPAVAWSVDHQEVVVDQVLEVLRPARRTAHHLHQGHLVAVGREGGLLQDALDVPVACSGPSPQESEAY